MRVSAGWLQEYLSRTMSTRTMAEALESGGIEVEQIIDAKSLDENIVVAEVKKVVQHPKADKLKVVEVDNGRSLVKLVCGADNVRAGQKVPYAAPGTRLPDGTQLKIATIRGVDSPGMICSGQELQLEAKASGILVLDQSAKPGTRLNKLFPADDIIDLKTAANRSDLLSIVGLAREISAQKGWPLKWSQPPAFRALDSKLPVEVVATDLAPRYLALKLRVDNARPSPPWLTQRLLASGLRPINLVVDIANYVMAETGQPLHAFAADKVSLPIKVRTAKSGEKLKTLDGQTRTLSSSDLVIAGRSGAIAIAGVMGGQASQVMAETAEIILESATFNAPNIRKTALRLGLRTDASGRFERGLPVQLAPIGMARAVELLRELAEAQITSELNDQLQIWPWVQHIGVRTNRLSQLAGFRLAHGTITTSLRRLGFTAESFDITVEAKKHLGKPYKWGASFKTDGTSAFDCGYLNDYIYSLIGVWIGHTAYDQYKSGRPVNLDDLRPGDLLFHGGPWITQNKVEKEGVSHVVIYIGSGKVINAKDFDLVNGHWEARAKTEQKVISHSLDLITTDSGYGFKGARRYVEELDDYVTVTVPWWRPDVIREEDILEEVVRIVGYERVPATLPAWRPNKIEFDQFWPKVWQVKQLLKGLGLFEVVTYSFISRRLLEQFGKSPVDHLKLKNPLSIEQAYLRSDLLPSLVEVARRNDHFRDRFGVFELSKVYLKKGATDLPDEPLKLGVLIKNRAGYQAVKTVFDGLGRELLAGLAIKPKSLPNFQSTRSAEIGNGRQQVGIIGQLDSQLLSRFKLKTPVSYLELDFGQLLVAATPKVYQTISPYPGIDRDLALVVKEVVSWQEVSEQILKTGLAEPEFLSEYRGADLPAGNKSLAIRLHFQSYARTLTEKEVEADLIKVVMLLERRFGAKIKD